MLLRIVFSCICIFNFAALQATYVKCPWVEDRAWVAVQPYLLPEDHPVKGALDAIFGSARVTLNIDVFKNAGFDVIPMIGKRKVVGLHDSLKGYVIKTYLDNHNIETKDWKLWIHRILGARMIQASLDKHGYNDIMKVPKKWIYPLPPEPMPDSPPKYIKNFMLVAEDMQPLKTEKNMDKFRKMTKRHLDALYIMLKENLLHDSIYIHNIPFCKDGRIAFIDTEHYNSTSRRVRYEKLTRYFSPYMQAYWTEITKKG